MFFQSLSFQIKIPGYSGSVVLNSASHFHVSVIQYRQGRAGDINYVGIVQILRNRHSDVFSTGRAQSVAYSRLVW